jgi:predicted NBD/HSP70 family sugar kinase
MARSANPSVLVFDVGGSHVSAALCSAEGYRLGPVKTVRQIEPQTSDAFVEALYSLAKQVSADDEEALGAALAMPGPFDYAAGVSWMRHKLPYLYGVDLRQMLAARFAWPAAHFHFLNDAAAFLLGEIGAGVARGVPRVVGITLGTGIGSAFAVNGSLVTAGPGVPPGGEIWNLPYEGAIVEDFISTRAIRKSYQERSGQDREVASIAHYASGGDATAIAVFAEFGRQLGLALRSLLYPFAPEVVVLGGGISRSAYLFLPAAEEQLQGLAVQLRISALRDNAALVGAGVAWFASQDQAETSSAGQSATITSR